MGIYLNGKNAYGMFQEDSDQTYFVDKTDILDELVPIVERKKTERRKQQVFGEKVRNISALPDHAVLESQ